MSFKLGGNAKIYYGGTTRVSWPTSGAAAGLTVLNRVGDVTIDSEKNDEDSTTRDTGGVETSFGGLIKVTVNAKLVYDPTDAGYQALEANYWSNNGQSIALAALDGPSTTVGTRGLWMDAQVLSWKKGEPVKGLQTVDVTFKPVINTNYTGTNATNAEWIVVGTGPEIN